MQPEHTEVPRKNQEVEGQEGIPQEYPGGEFRLEQKKERRRGRQIPVRLGRTIRGIKQCSRWGLSSEG
jgi:hypothetical protein